MNTVTPLICCLLSAAAGRDEPADAIDRPVPRYHVSKQFEAALNRPVAANWEHVGLRYIFGRVSSAWQIAVLLDRRVDPSRKLAIDLNESTRLDAIKNIAARGSARVRVVGNLVYIGPPDGARKLRTLIRLRSNELFGELSQISKRRQFELVDRWTLHWNDLDRPVDLVQRIAQRFKLKVDGLDRLPHDLWAGSTLPRVNALEALSLILIQFDLTFEWTEGANGVRIVPAPKDVAITRTYSVRGMAALAAAERWRRQIPGLRAERRGDEVLVRGTVEQHEAVEALLNPSRKSDRPPKKDISKDPLSRRSFTLSLKQIPVSAIMKKLQSTGITFQYDAQRFKDAGIDLNTRIDVDVNDATAEPFLRSLFDPLGVKFSFKDRTVTLMPK